jgi:hypothetical protein
MDNNFSFDNYYKHFISINGTDDYYKYFIGIDSVIFIYLVIKNFPVVVNLATQTSFSIMLMGAVCMLIDSWNRKSIEYRLYVELYENEYQANSDYKVGKIFINLVFYVLSMFFVYTTFGAQ